MSQSSEIELDRRPTLAQEAEVEPEHTDPADADTPPTAPPNKCAHTLSDPPKSPDLCTECATQISQLTERTLISPIQHLLSKSSRYIPTAEEEEKVRQVISEADERIRELDAKVARLRMLMSHITAEKQRIRDYADKHRVLVAPVWVLPHEILSYIFCLSVPPHGLDLALQRSSLKRVLLLGQINQLWRRVALATPQLWDLIIVDHRTFSKSDPDPVFLAQECVQRAGACPLTLSVVIKEHSEEVLGFIIPLADRCQRLILDVPYTVLPALSPIQGHLSLLKVLELKNMHTSENPVDDSNHLQSFSEAPSLQFVSTTCIYHPSFNVFPWKQLTIWDSPVRIPDFPRIFELAPKLKECFLMPMRPLALHPVIDNPMTLAHNLTSLHISTGAYTSFTLQLQHLPRFPSLRRLFLYVDKRVVIHDPENTLVPLFERSGSQLEHLTFGVSVPPSTIKECLLHAPSLTSLHLHRLISDTLLTDLEHINNPYAVPDEPPLVPKLETLFLSGKIYFPAQAVTRIIRARWAGAETASSSDGGGARQDRCLKAVHIWPPRQDKFEAEPKKELMAFGRKGFDIQIRQLDRASFLSHSTPLTKID